MDSYYVSDKIVGPNSHYWLTFILLNIIVLKWEFILTPMLLNIYPVLKVEWIEWRKPYSLYFTSIIGVLRNKYINLVLWLYVRFSCESDKAEIISINKWYKNLYHNYWFYK